jgi:hypothetical protein
VVVLKTVDLDGDGASETTVSMASDARAFDVGTHVE